MFGSQSCHHPSFAAIQPPGPLWFLGQIRPRGSGFRFLVEPQHVTSEPCALHGTCAVGIVMEATQRPPVRTERADHGKNTQISACAW